MRTAFVDTSCYVALVNSRDALHGRAVQLASSYQGDLVTTDYVLIEAGNFFARMENRNVFVNLLDALQADSKTTILPGTREFFLAGAARYRSRPDKDWSLTDCISFIVMEKFDLSDALTADHHFEQAGFTAWLR
jgi:uncharacterized protein